MWVNGIHISNCSEKKHAVAFQDKVLTSWFFKVINQFKMHNVKSRDLGSFYTNFQIRLQKYIVKNEPFRFSLPSGSSGNLSCPSTLATTGNFGAGHRVGPSKCASLLGVVGEPPHGLGWGRSLKSWRWRKSIIWNLVHDSDVIFHRLGLLSVKAL